MAGEVEEVFEDMFVCKMCKNKSFKTEGAFNSHLKSKQHKQREKQVKALQEELALDPETEALNAAMQQSILEEQKRKQTEKEEAQAAIQSDGEVDSDPESIELRKKMNKRQKKEDVGVSELPDA